ncbi:hypothetical protein Y032_0245g3556 [Ancylostoma ceylanicum]|uniref:Uncharacterized protein n=1 Tax=Ancylostoma ceylanicum TaxID=53326 RepID=A0A016SD19_9BILA|nr:hypothetical protein Y032_0245g3556 [Ancylostoma ceylanicum]
MLDRYSVIDAQFDILLLHKTNYNRNAYWVSLKLNVNIVLVTRTITKYPERNVSRTLTGSTVTFRVRHL